MNDRSKVCTSTRPNIKWLYVHWVRNELQWHIISTNECQQHITNESVILCWDEWISLSDSLHPTEYAIQTLHQRPDWGTWKDCRSKWVRCDGSHCLRGTRFDCMSCEKNTNFAASWNAACCLSSCSQHACVSTSKGNATKSLFTYIYIFVYIYI